VLSKGSRRDRDRRSYMERVRWVPESIPDLSVLQKSGWVDWRVRGRVRWLVMCVPGLVLR
jgi:hypothetical protein